MIRRPRAGPWSDGRSMRRAARRGRHILAAAAATVIAMVACTGCRRTEPPPVESVSNTVQRGPYRLTVSARPKQAWLGDAITIELFAHTPEGCRVEFPPPEALQDWSVTGRESSGPRPGAEGGLDWRQVYVVESYTSGTREIPPLSVRYTRRAESAPPADGRAHEPAPASADADWGELTSGTLTVELRSALTSQDSVTAPRDVTGTLLPPRRPTARAWLLASAGLLGAGLLLWGGARALRRRRARPAPPVPPVVWALRELARLEQTDWFEPQRVREFYYRLSEIVRVYIERQFGLRAPEMTSEEFMGMLVRQGDALPCDRDRLRAFLEACDVVKYAAFRPRREDAEEALRAARAFVDSTAAEAERLRIASGPGSVGRAA